MNTWYKNMTVYHLFPLGLCGAPQNRDSRAEPVNRIPAMTAWLPHIKELGADALYLGPVFESVSHGYDTVDYFSIDRRLGTNSDFAAFCEEAHTAGFRIILDGVFNHVGRDFPGFRDLLEHGENSQYKNWFAGVDFTGSNGYGDPFRYEGWNGYDNLVKLNLANPEVREHLFEAVRFWIREFGIDGLRLDAADCLPFWFLNELSGVCKSEKPDFWMMGEVIHGDYSRWLKEGGLDSVTSYECYKGLFSSHNDRNYFEIAYSLNRQFGEGGLYKDALLYSFADNHDVSRIGSALSEYRHIHPLHILLFTIPGIPSIYYGSEWGIRGVKDNGEDWHLRPQLQPDSGFADKDNDLPATIRNLVRIRKSSPALRTGGYRQLTVSVDGEQLAFVREQDGETIAVLVNASEEERQVSLQEHFPDSALEDLLNPGEAFHTGQPVPLSPCWGRILRIR